MRANLDSTQKKISAFAPREEIYKRIQVIYNELNNKLINSPLYQQIEKLKVRVEDILHEGKDYTSKLIDPINGILSEQEKLM